MKIRTDFVTNSSSSSFTLVICIVPKKGNTIRFEADGGVGEGFEDYYELVATKGPRELAESESIEALITALKESVGENGVYGKGPALEENRILTDETPFIKKIRGLSSMDDIEKISISGLLEGRCESSWYQYFSYNRVTGETEEEEEGEDFLSEGTGGALRFQEAYGSWHRIDGRSYFGTAYQVEKEHEKHLERYKEYKEKMKEYLSGTFASYLKQENARDLDVNLLAGDIDVRFYGRSFSVESAEFSDELKREIWLRGGRILEWFGKTSDYMVINLHSSINSDIDSARACIANGRDIKLITDFQLWKGFLNDQIPVYSENDLDEKDRRVNPTEEALMEDTDYHSWSNKGETFRNRGSEPGFYARYEKYITDNPDIQFPGKLFAFTGMLDKSTAKAEPLVRAIMILGGDYRANVSGKTDYLVIESLDSAGDGKMSDATSQIDKGKPLQIITAESLLKAIDSRNVVLLPLTREEVKQQEEQAKQRALDKQKQKEREAYLRQQAIEQKQLEAELRRRKAALEREAIALERKRKLEERMLAERELMAKKAEAKRQRDAEKAEAERLAHEVRIKKHEEMEQARANAVILYAPGEEPEPLRTNIKNFMAKLDGAYPDHVIVNITKDHRHWDERITELYRRLGYADRASFLEAYGFKVNSDKGGRPKTVDPEAVIAELKRRYPDGTDIGMDELKSANKDLPIKTLANSAKELFGMGLGVYLKDQGILLAYREKKPGAGHRNQQKPLKKDAIALEVERLKQEAQELAELRKKQEEKSRE